MTSSEDKFAGASQRPYAASDQCPEYDMPMTKRASTTIAEDNFHVTMKNRKEDIFKKLTEVLKENKFLRNRIRDLEQKLSVLTNLDVGNYTNVEMGKQDFMLKTSTNEQVIKETYVPDAGKHDHNQEEKHGQHDYYHDTEISNVGGWSSIGSAPQYEHANYHETFTELKQEMNIVDRTVDLDDALVSTQANEEVLGDNSDCDYSSETTDNYYESPEDVHNSDISSDCEAQVYSKKKSSKKKRKMRASKNIVHVGEKEDPVESGDEDVDENSTVYCLRCSKDFRRIDLIRHMIKDHGVELPGLQDVTNSDLLTCDMCGQIYKRRKRLNKHKKRHLTPASERSDYMCTVCGRMFVKQVSLTVHMRKHTGERPYSCTFCDKTFREKNALKYHLMIHKGEYPHLCDICGDGFRTRQTLEIHKLTHLDTRPLECPVCEKRFVRKHILSRHMKTHTMERLHSCVTCNKKFARADHLKEHMMLHTGARPHNCEICGKTFTRRDHLQRHAKNTCVGTRQ